VHCVAGVSRSATIVIAYLVARERMWLRDAFRFVQSRRRIIRPNPGFMEALARFEVDVRGASSISDCPDRAWKLEGIEAMRQFMPKARLQPVSRQCWLCCCCFVRCYPCCGGFCMTTHRCSGQNDFSPEEPTGATTRSCSSWAWTVLLDMTCTLD